MLNKIQNVKNNGLTFVLQVLNLIVFFLLYSQVGIILHYSIIVLGTASLLLSCLLFSVILNLHCKYRCTVYKFQSSAVFLNMLYSLAISVLLLLSIEKTSKLVQATYKLIVMFFENEDFFPLNFDQNYNKVKENTIFINFFGGVLFNYYFASCCTLLFSVCDRVCALIFYSLHKRIGRKVTIVTIILMHISSIFLSSLPMITKAYYLRYELVRNTIVIINGVNCKTFLLGTFLPLLVILLFLICFYLYIVAKHFKKNVANN